MFVILILVLLAIFVGAFFYTKKNLAPAVQAYQSFVQAGSKSRDSYQYERDVKPLKETATFYALAYKGSLVAIGLCLVLIVFNSFTTVPAGHVAVLDTFGSVSDRVLAPGVSPINPLTTPREMRVQTLEAKEEMDCPTKEGLSVHLEVSLIYHLQDFKCPELYRKVGSNYLESLVLPQFRSIVRGATASFEAKSLYTSDRDMLSLLIKTQLDTLLESRGIVIESTPLRKVTLPGNLAAAIEEKLKSEQESQRMQFVLTKEKQEAERKRIEAQGIQDFQTIVAKGISDQLLRWKGIEATENISKSPNAKIVIIGSGKDGLPIILDTK